MSDVTLNELKVYCFFYMKYSLTASHKTEITSNLPRVLDEGYIHVCLSFEFQTLSHDHNPDLDRFYYLLIDNR